MPVPTLILFDEIEVHQRIWSEVALYPHRETGGILVGQYFRINQHHVLVVVAATGPGRAADHQETTFAPDSRSLQGDLEQWRKRYRAFGVDYVGEWHKHPPGYPNPSTGDHEQAARILADPGYMLPEGLLTPIITVEEGVLKIHVHYFLANQRLPMAIPANQVLSVNDDMSIILNMLTQQHQPLVPTFRWGVDPRHLNPRPVLAIEDAVDWVIEDSENSGPASEMPPLQQDTVSDAIFELPSDALENLVVSSMHHARIGRDYDALRRAASSLQVQVGPLEDYRFCTIELITPIRLALSNPASVARLLSPQSPGSAGTSDHITGIYLHIDDYYPQCTPMVYLIRNYDQYLQIDMQQLFRNDRSVHQNLLKIVEIILKRIQQLPTQLSLFVPQLTEHLELAITHSELVVRKLADVLYGIGVQISNIPASRSYPDLSKENIDVSDHS